MATVASVSTANPGNASSITVTKPTGLAVGDLMIFHYTFNDATDTANTISGWTHEVNNYGANQKTGIQYKIADSSDTAASDFTLSFTGTVGGPLAAILRITDYATDNLLNENKDTGANGDTTLSMSVTPALSNNLLLMFIANNEIASISNYAVATDNPTWTEQYDIQSSTSGLACASATRTQTTATGDSTFTSSVGTGTIDFFGILVSIDTPVSVTTTLDTAGVLTLSSPEEKTFTLDNNFTLDTAGTVTLSTSEPTTTTTSKTTWTNDSKPNTTWTNDTL